MWIRPWPYQEQMHPFWGSDVTCHVFTSETTRPQRGKPWHQAGHRSETQAVLEETDHDSGARRHMAKVTNEKVAPGRKRQAQGYVPKDGLCLPKVLGNELQKQTSRGGGHGDGAPMHSALNSRGRERCRKRSLPTTGKCITKVSSRPGHSRGLHTLQGRCDQQVSVAAQCTHRQGLTTSVCPEGWGSVTGWSNEGPSVTLCS